MFQSNLRRLCALTVAGLAIGSGAAQITLDDFSVVTDGVWPIELSDDAPMFSVTEQDGIGLGDLMSRRITDGEFEAADIVEIDEAEVGIFASAGLLNYASFSGAEAKLTLTYDGMDGNGIGQSLLGQDAIEVSLADFDAANAEAMNVSVNVVYADMSEDNASELVTINGAQDLEIPVVFTGSDVTSISITFEPDRGVDFRLDEINIVPEPATAGLLALSGLLLFRRR